jgi:hypothetical protein
MTSSCGRAVRKSPRNRLAWLLNGREMPGLNTARHIFLEEAERGLYADWELNVTPKWRSCESWQA